MGIGDQVPFKEGHWLAISKVVGAFGSLDNKTDRGGGVAMRDGLFARQDYLRPERQPGLPTGGWIHEANVAPNRIFERYELGELSHARLNVAPLPKVGLGGLRASALGWTTDM